MADVFISHAREDQEFAADLAQSLQNRKVSVWWDRSLNAGDDFRQRILAELNGAVHVLVLWSPNSVKSRFVIDEANRAATQQKLLPFMIEACELPLGFGGLHYRVLPKSKHDVDIVLSAMAQRSGGTVIDGASDAQKCWTKMGANPNPLWYLEFTEKFPDDPLAVAARTRLAVGMRIGQLRQKRLEELARIPNPRKADKLTRIKGVGTLIEAALNGFGIEYYKQIAAWGTEDMHNFEIASGYTGLAQRIQDDNWAEQALILARGGQTEFSRDVDRRNIVVD